MTVCYAHGNEESSSTNAKPGRPLRDLWLHYAELRNRQLRLRGAWIQTAWRECFNKQVADASGLTGFEDAKFEPVGLTDSTGEIHEFHFRTHLFVAGVSIDAFELRDGHPSGYQFQIIADPEEDLLACPRKTD